MTQVLLIRPGATVLDEQNRVQGVLDVPLSDRGRAEVAVGVAQRRVGPAHERLVAVGESVVVVVGIQRVRDEAVEPGGDLLAVGQAVVVAVGVERIRAAQPLVVVGQPVVVGVHVVVVVGVGAGVGVAARSSRVCREDEAPAVENEDVRAGIDDGRYDVCRGRGEDGDGRGIRAGGVYKPGCRGAASAAAAYPCLFHPTLIIVVRKTREVSKLEDKERMQLAQDSGLKSR